MGEPPVTLHDNIIVYLHARACILAINPSEESEEFMAAIKLLFDCLFKLLTEPPFFKLYPNKVYRDLRKGFTVSIYVVP